MKVKGDAALVAWDTPSHKMHGELKLEKVRALRRDEVYDAGSFYPTTEAGGPA